MVYEAESVTGDARFAIKVLDLEWSKDASVVARFAREGRAASAARSPHIVEVLDGGTEDGRPYLVMELLPGEDLGKRLRRARVLPIESALHVVDQVLQALGAAHAQGIVHRDLKPDNVLLFERDGDPDYAKLVDFGMSKIEARQGGTAPVPLTRRGLALGTPLYMSPEQARAAPDLDARSDLYSAGAILFECLAGRPPIVGPTQEQVLINICTQDAPDVRRYRAEVGTELARFVAKALAREPDARFPTAEAMREAMRAAGQMPGMDPATLRRRARVRMAAALLIAALAGTLLTLAAIAVAGR